MLLAAVRKRRRKEDAGISRQSDAWIGENSQMTRLLGLPAIADWSELWWSRGSGLIVLIVRNQEIYIVHQLLCVCVVVRGFVIRDFIMILRLLFGCLDGRGFVIHDFILNVRLLFGCLDGRGFVIHDFILNVRLLFGCLDG